MTRMVCDRFAILWRCFGTINAKMAVGMENMQVCAKTLPKICRIGQNMPFPVGMSDSMLFSVFDFFRLLAKKMFFFRFWGSKSISGAFHYYGVNFRFLFLMFGPFLCTFSRIRQKKGLIRSFLGTVLVITLTI